MPRQFTNAEERFTMPPGDPDTWDVIQEVDGHALAKAFAREWMVDRDPTSAVLRLGYTGSTKRAGQLGRALYANTLVMSYLVEEKKNFCVKSGGGDYDTYMDLMFAEAQDRGFGSSATARVAALKTLIAETSPHRQLKSGGTTDEDGEPEGGGYRVNVYLNSTTPKPNKQDG